MTLTNYWWLLIWLFIGGGALAVFMSKRQELVLGKTEKRWGMLSAFVLILPYIIWAGCRSNSFEDMQSSKWCSHNGCNSASLIRIETVCLVRISRTYSEIRSQSYGFGPNS